MTPPPALEVECLSVDLVSGARALRVLSDVSFRIEQGTVFGLVGESGSGKSMTALSVMSLLPTGGCFADGDIKLEGKSLKGLASSQMRRLRGDRLSMIFQEPMTSLNPVLTIGFQIAESLRTHRRLSKLEAAATAVELLRKVGIPDPERVAKDYPHRLSGGMRQRVMIAIAMACTPRLLIADEPTTALDATVQAQVLDLIEDLREETKAAVLLITHNFGVIAQKADQVAVMYAGQIVEQASVKALLAEPLHPYTQALLSCIPRLGCRSSGAPVRLSEIRGELPQLTSPRTGCSFASRCPKRTGQCVSSAPQLERVGDDHQVRCFAVVASQVA